MAERRMFAKKIVNSAKFLKMPTSSRLLYYDLGMSADDDGIVEAFTVMRLTGATEDDLRVLVSKEFVKVLNDELVSVILDWKQNNLIKKDRYHESLYHELLLKIDDNNKWNTIGTQMEPEVSIGKVSIGKNNIKHKYGTYQNVLLTDDEYNKLKNEFTNYEEWIERVSLYCQSTGKKYKDYLATIRNWAKKEKKGKVDITPIYKNEW